MLTLNLGPSGGYSGGGGDKQRESDKLDTCGPRPEGGRRKPAALRLWARRRFASGICSGFSRVPSLFVKRGPPRMALPFRSGTSSLARLREPQKGPRTSQEPRPGTHAPGTHAQSKRANLTSPSGLLTCV